jgi:hypothetical protein
MRAANYGKSANYRSQDTVLFLLFNGANPKTLNNDGFTALHFAVQACNEQVVRLFMQIKTPVTVQKVTGPAVLHVAIQTGNRNIIESILRASPNAKPADVNRLVKRYDRPTSEQRMRTLFDTIAKTFVACFIVGTVCWEYPQYVFVYYPATPELFPVHMILLVISSITWCLWVKVAFCDPGFVDRNQRQYHEITTKRLPAQVKRKLAASLVRQPLDPYAYARLCHLCQCVQPEFTHHCSRCKRCVRWFDHHCVYLCNCIAVRNKIAFHCLLAALVLCGMLNMLVVVSVIFTHESGFTILHLANLIYSIKLILTGVILLGWQISKYFTNQNKLTRLKGSSNKPMSPAIKSQQINRSKSNV